MYQKTMKVYSKNTNEVLGNESNTTTTVLVGFCDSEQAGVGMAQMALQMTPAQAAEFNVGALVSLTVSAQA